MRPTNRLFLFALIIFFLFGTVPVVHAVEPTAEDFTNASSATCDDPPISYFGEITSPAQVPPQIDYYAVDLVAGQFFTIDIDAEKIGSPLDSILEVFDADGNLVAVSVESSKVPSADPASSASGMETSPDPYLEMTVDLDGTYYLAISAETPGAGADTGSYTFFLKCSDQSTYPEFKWPVEVGDLIGSTGSDTGSLINITPGNAKRSLPFDLGVGPIADIEYQYSTDTLLVAINQNPGSIITFDPATGDQVKTFSLVPETGTVVPTVVALEAAENELYGVQADLSEQFSLVQVTFDDSALTAMLTPPVFSFGTQHVRALAYHPSEKILYGVSGTALLKINLSSLPVGIEEIPLIGLSFEIASMDFSHEEVLYVVDVEGNLYEVLSLATGEVRLINPINATGGVSGLTFVVGECPDVDPIKTICSSTLTTSASASSETSAPKLSRFKLKKNPLHRAIGLFKFEGMEGETVTLNVKLDGEESEEAVAGESSASELENSWLNHWKGKGRVFLGIRDSMPDVNFRVRKKEHIPFAMSATLPANGTYYIMLIRPLLRSHKTDYCLTLESNYEDSQAWETFDVAWPRDDSDDGTASTLAAESDDVQNNTETLAGESADEDPVQVTLSTTAVAPISAPPEEITHEETGDVSTEEVPPAENLRDPVDADKDDGEGAPTDAGDIAVEETLEVTPEESAAGSGDTEVGQTDVGDTTVEKPLEVTPEEPAAGGGDTEVGQTFGNETPVVEPVAEIPVVTEPAADGGDDTEVGQTAADGTTMDEPVDGSR